MKVLDFVQNLEGDVHYESSLRCLACCYIIFSVRILGDSRIHFMNSALGEEPFMRFDRPHTHHPYHHININTQYYRGPDPHEPISEEIFNVSISSFPRQLFPY